MLSLLDHKQTPRYSAYVWQRNINGFDYEIEIIDKEGDKVYHARKNISSEQARELMHDNLRCLEHDDAVQLFNEMG